MYLLVYFVGAVCVLVGAVSSAALALMVALAVIAFLSFAWVTK
jgi:hypothetical protein